MLNIKLTLKKKDDKKVQDQISSVKRKQGEGETLEEAWIRILSMKNSEADQLRLREVREAMESGKVGRHPDNVSKRFSKAEALRLYSELAESQKEEKLRELVENTPSNYILVDNAPQLMKMYENLMKEPIIAVDTETTGVDVYSDKIVGISFTAPSIDVHYYVPIRHDIELGERQLSLDGGQTVRPLLKEILENENIEKVFHNAIFDLHILEGEGIEVKGLVHDTMIIQHLLNENEPTFRLKDLVKKYLKIDADNFDELFGKNCKFNTVPLDIALYYAAKDTHVTYLLYKFQMSHLTKPHLTEVLNNYLLIEQPLIKVVQQMERVGFKLDLMEVTAQEKYLETRQMELESLLVAHFGEINFNSPMQLKEALKSKGLQQYIKGYDPKKDNLSTDSKTLKVLAKYDEGCKYLLEYKDNSKQLSSFVKSLPTMVKPDGKIHGSFKQTGTATGRFSSVNPNLQQQPQEARKMFLAEDGYVLLGADFGAQEPRMLTHFTQEPTLLEIYDKGLDLYATLASQHYKKSYDECNKHPDGKDTKERKTFKVVVLAVMYGMGAGSLADMLGINKKEAQHLIDSFYKNNKKVSAWIEQNQGTAKKLGYVETLFGRKRRLPEAKSRDEYVQFRALRQCTNARIQGSSAEQTKLVMIEADKTFRKYYENTGRLFRIAATIHDEVLYLVPEDVTREEVKMIEDLMVNTVKLNNVKSKTDIEIGKCWGAMVSVDDWFKEEK